MEHNSSVSEVAYSCGFNDMSYFAKEFKKKYGKAPNQFKVQ
ncbi:helix-turn-helix domain-containing protein [Enterocloster clostridioformis]